MYVKILINEKSQKKFNEFYQHEFGEVVTPWVQLYFRKSCIHLHEFNIFEF